MCMRVFGGQAMPVQPVATDGLSMNLVRLKVAGIAKVRLLPDVLAMSIAPSDDVLSSD